jgi:hypothetical protein
MNTMCTYLSYIKGHVYVAGGTKESPDKTEHIRHLYDVWSLDLTKFDGWKEHPSYPNQSSNAQLFGVQMTVHEDKAYFFAGRPKLDFFDLRTHSWGSILTSFTGSDGKSGNGKWPYPSKKLEEYSMQMIDGHLYVFGGVHPNAVIGCNLLVVFDMETRKWTTLSGTVHPVADHSCPGPRKLSASWVNKEKDRLYILFGLADRLAARFSGQSHGATNAFVDVDDEEERRIAMAGPWKRCFSCGSAGKWSKCGGKLVLGRLFVFLIVLLGTCRGRVFFCDPQCLKEGWKEHKHLHNCRKAT